MNRPFRVVPSLPDEEPEEPMDQPDDQHGSVAVREVELPQEYDAEVAHSETLTGPPVDLPESDDERLPVYATITGRDELERRPILPVWARSRTDLAAGVRWWGDRQWYRMRWHAAKSPAYAGRVLKWAPVGAGRIIARGWRWTWDLDTAPLRASRIAAGDTTGYLTLVERRNRQVKARVPIAGSALLATAGGGTVAWLTLPWWAQTALWGGLLLGLARVGRPIDKPITSPAVTITRYQRITAEQVREALCSLGIAGLKDPKKITFPDQIHRDGPGQLARVNLPHGVEAIKVCEERGKLSSALRKPVDQVWPTGGPDHAGQLDLWVGFQPASKMKPPTWSIAADGARTSVFEPIDFGADQRQRPVASTLFARNWLIGGVPGSGKSYFARALALAAALDPTVEFKIAEFKGTADFGDFDQAGLCSAYYCGVDDEALEGGADIIAWGLAEAERRGKRIRKFREQGRAPEGKVTPELAAERGSGLHPVVIVIDEAHELLVDPEVATAAERLIKRGRALGLIVILATQIPDAKSVPPIITRCVTMRACLAVQDHIANDMILGTGSYKRGVTATAYRPGLDAGWGMVTGLEAPTAVRAQYPDEATTKKILARAVQLRGGVMPGSGQEAAPRLDVLVDVQRVWPAGRDRAQWQQLAESLAELRPETYGDLTGDSLSALVRGLGVSTLNVKAGGAVLKGCLLIEVQAAVERREVTRG
jgi:S-DNA-T family DNA segregation ATPase FtsK/SpoIIIE